MRHCVVRSGVVALVVGVAGAAAAHPSVLTATIPVGRPVTILVEVPSEQTSPMVGAEIAIPAAFVAEQATATRGWRATAERARVSLSGEGLITGLKVLVRLTGRAERNGRLKFDVLTRQADGSTVRWDGEPGSQSPAVFVQAGTPGTAATPAWRRPSTLVLAVVAALGVGASIWLLTGRRDHAARTAASRQRRRR